MSSADGGGISAIPQGRPNEHEGRREESDEADDDPNPYKVETQSDRVDRPTTAGRPHRDRRREGERKFSAREMRESMNGRTRAEEERTDE